ncbi:haloacid dehalogenase type II [Halosolutus halophilus]|uniref:haloacid dehalogenase type II n=1 Tax=Halosolutus halophilus TaxID=1552990 RepID=UPI0022350A34|nr:haloacid dehalogenase type II [Halosolutus halophilus]
MAVAVDDIETITFDSFTTLVDVLGSTDRVLRQYVDDPDPIVTRWRTRAVEYRMLCNFVGAYEPYQRTTRQALKYALAVHDVELSEETIDAVANVFRQLDVFGDVADSFEQLDDAGYDLYIVSNGEPELLDAIVERADVDDHVIDTISADEIEIYKPDAAIYQHASNRTDTPLENVVHVATPWYDVFGAMNAGMQAVWVNRQDLPWETYDGEPDLIVDDLFEFVAAFDE